MLNETLMLILLSTQSVDRPIQEDCSSYEANPDEVDLYNSFVTISL